MFPGVSTAAPGQEGNKMSEDRTVNINIPKEVPFTLSHFTIDRNVNFNVNYNAREAIEFRLLWPQCSNRRDVTDYFL